MTGALQLGERASFTYWQPWFLRFLSLTMLVRGLFGWAAILGIVPVAGLPFEAAPPLVQIAIAVYAVADLIAAVGLWLIAAWGSVLWLLVLVTRYAATYFLPELGGVDWVALAFDSVTVLAFLVLSIGAGRENEG